MSEEPFATRAAGTPDHVHDPDTTVMFTQEFWDARYRSTDQVWSGNPNPHLVEHVSTLSPAVALDVGSGEGADALWLASRGWEVTAVDVSRVALERAAGRALQATATIDKPIVWEPADLHVWDPSPRRFDLVSAQFMYLPQPSLQLLFERLAAAVSPGGTLLIVGHHPSDPHMRNAAASQMLFTAEEVAATLDFDEWQSIDASSPEREKPDANGGTTTVRDAVLLAVRRA